MLHAFEQMHSGSVVYHASGLLRCAGVRHGFSTRLGGISTEAHLKSMNLGFFRGEDMEITRQNYRIFVQALGLDAQQLVFSNQTHTTRVMAVTAWHCGVGVTTPPIYTPGTGRDDPENEVDALVTATDGMSIGIRVADCVPVLFFDPDNRVIGAAHAGWRGTIGNIVENTLSAMEALGAKREQILCAIGPAIGQCCYEVDRAFRDRFFDTLGSAFCSEAFVQRAGCASDKFFCDLRTINAKLLMASGVGETHIDVSTACTCCHPDLFFSHRATAGKRGTMGAVIGLETPQTNAATANE